MFKLTRYKKVKISRNISLLMLVCLLVLVSGKIIMAHEKMSTYEEAMKLFKSGRYVAAEEKFRAAKLNFSITDHNQDIHEKLSILSPIREAVEDLDVKVAQYQEDHNLNKLVDTYERWKENEQKWVSGTSVQQDMYREMLALTKLDQDLESYFSSLKKTHLFTLRNTGVIGEGEEKEIFTILTKIPAEYYGDDAAKTKEIQATFQQYYAGKIKALTAANASVAQIVAEGSRQFGMLSKFSINNGWLRDVLDNHLLKVLTDAISKKEYATFAEQGRSVKKMSAALGEAKVISFIEKTKSNLMAKAKSLTEAKKYENANSLYEALKPLENTEQLIADVNHAWDLSEPIRVLKRLYPTKEFSSFVHAKNKWGADSVIAAISKDGGIYFGRSKGSEAMAVTEGTLAGTPTINELVFQSGFTTSANPVIYIDAKSKERNHHFLAYEVRAGSMVKILDVEADNLTIESKQLLLIDNPISFGAGELAYYEPDSNGTYHFTKIKADYIDINVSDILNYKDKKVRFTAFPAEKTNAGALVTISESNNNSTGQLEKTYLLLKGKSDFMIYTNYTVMGVFNGYEDLTNDNGETILVPVFQVEKVE